MPPRKKSQSSNIALRPRTFDEVIGLAQPIEALNNLFASGKIPRAFLLHGPFGCGKTTLAYLIAKQVSGAPEGSMNVQEVNAASVTGIDDMRALIDRSYQTPFEGDCNVIILDEAHKLSKPAQEALLKVLEEPSSPTIWIICTTEKDKLVEGIRAGRCFTIGVHGMGLLERQKLVERAALAAAKSGDHTEFLRAIDRAHVVSPRKILMAFDAYAAGMSIAEAVGGQQFIDMPEYWEICLGVVFGTWDKEYTLPWIEGRKFKGVGDQLRLLDERLKKRAVAETSPVDEDDVQGRPEVAQALRSITAATLKNQVIKANRNSAKAAEALIIIGNCAGLNSYGMEYSLVVGALFRVNQTMKG